MVGYKFCKDWDIAIGTAWRCTIHGHKTQIHTDSSGSILVNRPTSVHHNHAQTPDLAKKKKKKNLQYSQKKGSCTVSDKGAINFLQEYR